MSLWGSKSLSDALKLDIDIKYEASRIEFNSRDIQSGDLFIALKGARDGHLYVQDALDRGAAMALVEYVPENIKDISRLIKVSSCIDALNDLAIFNRSRLKAKIIGITGSVGKTSTKEAFKQALNNIGNIFCGRGNFNNYLGLPINLASAPLDSDYVVLELGMNHSGEIRELTKLLKPDIAIITKIAPAHLEFFDSVADIARAKSEIFEGLSEEGIAVINIDDEYFDIMHDIAKKYTSNIKTFGSNENANSMLSSYSRKEIIYNI